MTQALSLDFWGTLAVFNPAYSAARTAFLASIGRMPEAEALERYTSVKRRLDLNAELSGAAVTPPMAYEQLLARLNPSHQSAAELRERLEALVRAFPPILTPRTAETLRHAADAGLVLCLSSNTNFIAGSLLTELFADLPFHGRVYSDEVGVSKPHPDFFQAAMREIRKHHPSVVPGEVTHIGDNPVCDRDGAERAGMKAVLVRTPADTVDAIEKVIASRRGTK